MGSVICTLGCTKEGPGFIWRRARLSGRAHYPKKATYTCIQNASDQTYKGSSFSSSGSTSIAPHINLPLTYFKVLLDMYSANHDKYSTLKFFLFPRFLQILCTVECMFSLKLLVKYIFILILI